jgi:HAD superfamily hydrolase (TIGR01549 family)
MMDAKASLINVLVVSGGGFQGLAVIKGLLRSNCIRVVVADCFKENIGRCFAHRSYVVPRISEAEKFLNSLLEICRTENVQVVLPSTELELSFLAEHEERFRTQGIKVAVCSSGFLKIVCDKKELYAFLKREGLPAPELIEIATVTKYPIIGKPRSGWGGKGQLVFNSGKELQDHPLTDLREGYVWHPFLRDFVEYSIDFAINFDGVISDICVRERVRVSGGFAVIAKEREDGRVSEIAERFASIAVRHGARGVLNLQIIKAAGNYFISDVNPRIGTSATFGYGIGINLPAFVCLPGKEGEQKPSSHPAKPVTMIRYLEELFVRQESLNGVRAVVFDLDDTLMNQKRWILEKLRGLHDVFKSKLPDKMVFLEKAMAILEEGNRSRLIDALCKHFGLTAELNKELIESYREVRPREGAVYTDVWPVIEELKRRRYKLSVLTNNPPPSQRQKIEVCGFQNHFEQIIYAQELKAEKPAPEGFLEMARRLNLSPDEMVMVGDNLYTDIAGALRCGYRHGFLITRPGGFFNFDTDIFKEVSGLENGITTITSLRDTLRYLEELR